METKEPGGLFCNANRVPLTGVSIVAKVAGAAAEVSVTQRYVNNEKVPLEAVYSFPLQESAAVCGFEVDIGGKRIVGKVEEKETAFERYDEAMQEGHGAFIVDQDRPNIFTASVGNLLPKQEAVVRLSYAVELDQSGDEMRLLIPTTISPRYVPKDELKKMDPAEREHILPPTVTGGVPYGLKLSVEIDAAAEICEVYSPSHNVRASINGKSARLELGGDDVQLDHDFVVTIKLAKPHEATVTVARDGDGARTLMVTLFPDLSALKRGPCEFVFLIDRSGSMQGPSINQARAALVLALRSMEEGDRFNVLGFGSTYQALFPESVPYTQQTLDTATQHAESLQADLGGTELLPALKFALNGNNGNEPLTPRMGTCNDPLPEGEGKLPRQMILLTDGQLGNEAQVLSEARAHADDWRIFTFGIGDGVSEFALKAIARATRGEAEFIASNERIEAKVMRQFARLVSAFLKDVRVEWSGVKTDLLAPAQPPALFNGDRLNLYARVIGNEAGKPGVTVIAQSTQGELRFAAAIDLERVSDSRAVPVLMARKAIQELEESEDTGTGSNQVKRKSKQRDARVLELALRYQIMSSQTSFVAVEERVGNTQTERAQLRRIPVAMTKGWHGTTVDAFAVMSAPMPAASAPRPGTAMMARSMMAAPAAPPQKSFHIGGAVGGMVQGFIDAVGGKRKRAVSPPMPPLQEEGSALKVSEDQMYLLARLQKSDGCFVWAPDYSDELHLSEAELKQLSAELKCDAQLGERIIATFAALKGLSEDYGDRADEWKLMAAKARKWLAKQTVAVPAGFASLEDWAKSKGIA